jgi:sulfate permease
MAVGGWPLAALSFLTGVVSLALAISIGANNSAAEMGPAFGAGVRTRRQAVAIIGVFCAAGAVLAGHRVMATVGQDLIGKGTLSAVPGAGLVVVAAALALIGLANVLRLPLATSHAVVGAVVGFGLFAGKVNFPVVGGVLAWWVVTPLASLGISYLAGRTLYPRLRAALQSRPDERRAQRLLALAVTGSSCWLSFSAGSNSLAKAMGPAVGAGVLTPHAAAIAGGLAMAAGAVLFGGRMMQAVGREITRICPLCAFLIEVISATIVFAASRHGMPVSLAEIVTCSVIGFGCAADGVRGTAGNVHVRRMMVLWPAAPLLSAAAAFALSAIR